MNQNLSAMGVASCRRTFLCLILRVRLVLSQFSVRDWSPCRASRIGSCVSWVSIREVARPNPARPGPVRPAPAPGAPTLPRNNLPLPLPPLSLWCPRDWRRRSPEFGPRGELPSPSLLSSLPLPPLPFPACPPLSPLRVAAPAPCPSPARRRPPPAPPPHGGARPLPLRHAAAPAPCARRRPPLAPPLDAAAPAPGPGVVRPPLRPARPLPLVRSSLRAASAPCAWRPSSRRDSRGLVYLLTHSRVRKPTRVVIISGL
jgi:hypothetical protein